VKVRGHSALRERDQAREQLRGDVQAGFDQLARGEAVYDKTSSRQLAERSNHAVERVAAKVVDALSAVSSPSGTSTKSGLRRPGRHPTTADRLIDDIIHQLIYWPNSRDGPCTPAGIGVHLSQSRTTSSTIVKKRRRRSDRPGSSDDAIRSRRSSQAEIKRVPTAATKSAGPVGTLTISVPRPARSR
jgi:hypothetical protein